MPEDVSRVESERFFQRIFSFAETNYRITQTQLMKIARFESGPRGREHCCFATPHLFSEHGVEEIEAGWFYTPSVKELRDELQEELQRFESERPGYLELVRHKFHQMHGFTLSHDIGDSAALHRDQPGALFQAASQFNLLEFPHSSCVPEMGIGPYVYDRTQGPACAVSCAGAAAYRCYLMASRFVQGADGDLRGQTTNHQADMLRDVTRAITDGAPAGISRVPPSEFYTVRNGYFSSTDGQMTKLMSRIGDVGESRGMSRDDFLAELSSLLRIGVVEDASVTSLLHARWNHSLLTHKVTQTFNSALSLNKRYSSDSPWAIFAKMVLVGSYEATLLCGALHTLKAMRNKPPDGPLPPALPPIYLTKVGGGVFLNDSSWIHDAIRTACKSVEKYRVPMNVRLVHFRSIEESYMR